MNHKKINIAIIMGGKSPEHKVSLCSAFNVISALRQKKYTIIPLWIDQRGLWHYISLKKVLSNNKNYYKYFTSNHDGKAWLYNHNEAVYIKKEHRQKPQKIDVVFPLIHGISGEDGTLQGLLTFTNVAYVGSDTCASAIGFDKDITKRLLRDAHIPIVPFLTLYSKKNIPSFKKIVNQFSLPFFVKSAKTGSSIGINKVYTEQDYKNAIKSSFRYSTKVLIEKAIEGRELECAVLGNGDALKSSIVGEIITNKQYDFYSYESKYVDKNGAEIIVPAQLNPTLIKKVRKLAVKTTRILSCDGMARVDFFLTNNGKIYVNEINTIPGFTDISMYPRLWQNSGLSYSNLLDELIKLAIQRYKQKQKISIKI